MSALQAKLAQAEAAFRDALLSGGHTAALRQAISGIKHEITREAAKAEAAIAKVAQASEEAIAIRAKASLHPEAEAGSRWRRSKEFSRLRVDRGIL